jgi:hypothetical protein
VASSAVLTASSARQQPDALAGADEPDRRRGRLDEAAERDAEPAGQRPQRLDARVAAPGLELGERRAPQAGLLGEVGQGEAGLGAQRPDVRGDRADELLGAVH